MHLTPSRFSPCVDPPEFIGAANIWMASYFFAFNPISTSLRMA